MNILGYHTGQQGRRLDTIEFCTDNLQGLAGKLNADRLPGVVLSDNSFLKDGLDLKESFAPIAYIPSGGGIALIDTGEITILGNVFSLDAASLLQMIAYNPKRVILHIWQMIFHEVRHFAQFNILDREKDLFQESFIDRIAVANPSIAGYVHGRIKHYVGRSEQDYAIEIDATIVEVIAPTLFLNGFNEEGELDLSLVIGLLRMTNEELQFKADEFLGFLRPPSE